MDDMFAYTTYNSPVGDLLLIKRYPNAEALRSNTSGTLTRVTYLSDSGSIEAALFSAGYSSDQMIRDEELFITEAAQLDEYFEGSRRTFDLTYEIALPDGFQKEALKQVATVPYGETVSYGEVAILAGSPNAYRAAGSACGHNPLVILIPCHRIIKADGTIGDYGSSGRGRKKFLLKLESRNTANSTRSG